MKTVYKKVLYSRWILGLTLPLLTHGMTATTSLTNHSDTSIICTGGTNNALIADVEAKAHEAQTQKTEWTLLAQNMTYQCKTANNVTLLSIIIQCKPDNNVCFFNPHIYDGSPTMPRIFCQTPANIQTTITIIQQGSSPKVTVLTIKCNSLKPILPFERTPL